MTIIVGAGLAGLTCAKVLAEARVPFLLCESSQRPGGRVVTDRHGEGFILDRGFQVLLDSYPAARRHLDYAALGGGRFRAGAMFVGLGRPRVLENPLRRPSALLAACQGDIIPWADRLRLPLLVGRALLSRGSTRDVSSEELLRGFGFSETFFARFARPFFGGVLLDPSLQTSGELLLEYLRCFATGRALLPAGGMGAIGRQLAASVPDGSLRYGAAVAELVMAGGKIGGVRLADGTVLSARRVVLAVDEPAVCRLLGMGAPRAARGTAVHYFAASKAYYSGSWLCLPPRRGSSPVLHAALVSNAAPTLAPAGRHLWSVTVLPDHPAAADAPAVAKEVAGWFGADADDLRPLAFVRVPYAVPEQNPGFRGRPSPWGDAPPGIVTAGDAVCGASIDAVMASGEAAAKKVISSARGN
jgi:phytoene dehydrogenase-like protein